MKVNPYDENAFKLDHPRGTVSFNYLLMGGEPEKLENFRYILGRQEADFRMPRHRHSFEQIRLPLVGDMNLGEQGILREGEIGYFPEGLHYGPQDDPLDAYGAKPGERLQLVLQFGGASGLGMAGSRGRGPQARREEGEKMRRERREMKLPRPRYKNVIIMDPGHFNWLPVDGSPGVERKYFGSFSEREFWIEFVKVSAGAEWVSATDAGRRLIVVISGAASIDGSKIGDLAAVQVEPGEELRLDADEETVMYIVGLTPVRLPSTPSDQFDIEISDGAIQFEKKAAKTA
jgi:hypothetical protein